MQINSGTERWQPIGQASPPPGARPAQQLALTPSKTEPSPEKDAFQPFGDDGLSFFDILDVINPLQHLPFIGPMYREITGDELAAAPRMLGGALYFGAIGLVGSAVDVVLEEVTGTDLGGNILSAFEGQSGESPLDDENGDDRQKNGAEIVEAPSKTVSVQAEEPFAVGTDAADPVTAWAVAELNQRQAQASKLGFAMPTTPYSHLLTGLSSPIEATDLPTQPTPDWQAMRTDQDIRPGPNHPAEIRRANAAYRAASLNTNQTEEDQTNARAGGWFSAAMLEALAKAPPEFRAKPRPSTQNNANATLN